MVYKTILLTILSAFLLNAQIMLNPKRSDIFNPPSGEPPAGTAYIPDIEYADTAFTPTAGADSLTFTHYGSIAANDFILLIVMNEATGDGEWTDSLAVEEAGWNFVGEFGSGNGDTYIGIFWKVATGSETGSFDVNSTTSTEGHGWYLVLDSVDVTAPINIVGDTTMRDEADNIDSLTIEAATTTADYCLALGIACQGSSQPLSENMPTSGEGWVFYDATANRRDAPWSVGGWIVVKDVPSAGSTGSPTVYYGDLDNGQDGSVGFIMAIKGNN